jgi:hypothetical protein
MPRTLIISMSTVLPGEMAGAPIERRHFVAHAICVLAAICRAKKTRSRPYVLIRGATIVAALNSTALGQKGGGDENDREKGLVHFGCWWIVRT